MSEMPIPKRRWCRFSLRTLLIVVVLLSVGLAWSALKMREAERQRKAVEAIRRTGGLVVYDYQWDTFGGPLAVEEPPAPVWLTRLLGEDLFANVVFVELYDCEFGNAGLQHLTGLTKLNRLEVDAPRTAEPE